MKKCPICESTARERLRRKNFSRLLPTARNYKCSNCKSKYLWFSIVDKTMLLKKGLSSFSKV